MWLSELSPVGLLIQISTWFPLVITVFGVPFSALVVVVMSSFYWSLCTTTTLDLVH
jgi:hypothetical protein